MSIAVVFDSAGTLLHTYRVAKDVEQQRLLPGIETVTLTFSSPERVLVVIHVHSREIIGSDHEILLSRYLVSHQAGFGISCTRKITTAEDIGDVLYHDTHARIGDLQDCIKNVWQVCKRESVVTLNSGVILNMAKKKPSSSLSQQGGDPLRGQKRRYEISTRGVFPPSSHPETG